MHVAVPPHAIMHCWVCQIFEGPSNLHGPMALHDERWLTGAVPVCSNHQYGDAQGETPQTGSAPVLLNTRDYLPPWLDDDANIDDKSVAMNECGTIY